MYVKHVDFNGIENENMKIWRYMDFAKFVSLLNEQSLFFTRIDKFEDRFEGSFSVANEQLRPAVYGGNPPSQAMYYATEKIFNETKPFIIANCWHINPHESAAMWKLYLKSNEGIAIQSTFKRLADSFTETSKDVYIEKIRYIDYEKDWMHEGNVYYPLLHKRKSFEHEKELRAFIDESYMDEEDKICGPSISGGINVSVNVETLIENIYVSPDAPKWFSDLVKSITNKYGIQKPVEQSKLKVLY
ncbi:hypothetical protein NKR74_14605 [Bacillus sp. 3103sda1]|uniref:hypothetical protein n=1 Tax=Bacillus sp. 3103sda1 TaxID=2953808 RepID=UPI00209ECFFF|nr:hypothetical protein [Bacillus sp. 3103sda1]MCP1124519.1 hypothetical protein [Bacillus sp. 3103sda1]